MNNNCLPQLIGLGTQKGGTSTLNNMLRLHKRFNLPTKKEIHYFSQHWDQSLQWYKNYYKDSTDTKINVDITPYYLFHPEAASRIQMVVPDAKLIVLLRDPVERTISQYFHAKRLGFEELSIMDAIAQEEIRMKENYSYSHQKHSYIGRSKYIKQLERYEALFKKSQLLIIKSEDYFKNPRDIWQKIEVFMDIEPEKFPNNIKKANEGKGESLHVDYKIKEYLREIFRETKQKVKERYNICWD